MAKYRKKPVVVEAWRNSDDNGWPDWLDDADAGREPGGVILVRTLEGVMRAEPGDWIIKGVKGEVYPCKPDIFAETYELTNNLEESHWGIVVAGAKMIQAFYNERSIAHAKIQRLIERYEHGERTDKLKQELNEVE